MAEDWLVRRRREAAVHDEQPRLHWVPAGGGRSLGSFADGLKPLPSLGPSPRRCHDEAAGAGGHSPRQSGDARGSGGCSGQGGLDPGRSGDLGRLGDLQLVDPIHHIAIFGHVIRFVV